MRSNCLVWAWRRRRDLICRWVERGRPTTNEPSLCTRPSRLEPRKFPHFAVEFADTASGQWVREEFVPDDPTPLTGWRIVRALWFRGHVVRTVLVDDLTARKRNNATS